ncbi:MAG: (2Fe-2S) ferredoxin domain-containing protein [Alphaproteobacteria bacterium]|nr:(2Fe-2S) ferredoxin domain-containing protein [Alphaproteobacteria bacterium]
MRRPDDPPLHFRAHVFVCTNERPENHPRRSCARKESVKLRDYMKARAKELGLKDVRVNSAGCLDRCELGVSVVIYPEGVWYTVTSKADVDEILLAHLKDGGRLSRLLMPPEMIAADEK